VTANLLPLVLAVSLSGLAVTLTKEIERVPDRGAPLPAVTAGPVDEQAPAATFSLPALDQFKQTLERPLFADNRQPPAAPEPRVADQTEAPKIVASPRRSTAGLVLSAIVMAGDDRVALLRARKSGAARRLRVGERIDGWRVESIGPGAVVLSLRDERKTLALRRFGPPPPPKPLAPARQPQRNAKRPLAGALTSPRRVPVPRQLAVPPIPPRTVQPR